MSDKILITGAAGHLGRAVVKHLLETYSIPAERLVAASRDPAKLSDLAAKGVETRKADFDDASGLSSAFAGIDRILVISTDALAVPGQRLAQHRAAVAAAKQAGVRHIAYTSMPNPDRSLVTFAPDHLGSEEAVKASGLSYSIIRNAWYHDNYLMSMPHNLSAGQWFTSAGDGRLATIARDDCARAIAARLAAPAENSRIFTLTGTQSLTPAEIAAVFSESTGKPLAVVPVSDEQLKQGLIGAGLPDFVAAMLASADANIRAGNFDVVTTDYETLTGSKPQTLRDFVLANKAAFAG